jgi:hypothetical protein
MGKNEKRLLSAISPLYAASQGKLPGILGVGMSVMEDRKDKKEEEKCLEVRRHLKSEMQLARLFK